MKNLVVLRFVLALTFVCLGMIACSGSGSTPTPPPTTYTVTATAGTGTTISPAFTSVTAGGTAIFTVGLLSGYQNLVAVGCTISGTTCTTGVINANTTVSVSATAIPTYTVTLQLNGVTGTAPTSVVAGGTVTVGGVGLASGYQGPITATNCTISGTTCTSGAINANTTITLTATPIPTYIVTLQLAGTTGTLSATSVAAGGTVSVTGVGLASGYQGPITATNCTISGTTCTSGAINANTTISLAAVLTPGIDWVKKSLRAVYDADLLTTPVCFQVQTHGTGFHVVVTRTDVSNGESSTLNDAGTGCDTTKGDGIFSGALTMTSVPSSPYYGGKIGRLLFGIELVSDTSGTTLVSEGTQLRVASSTLRGTVNTTLFGAFTIAPNALLYNVPYSTSKQDVAKAVYGIVKDTYDGLAMSQSRSNSSTGFGTQDYSPVRQPVVYGIGSISGFDESSSYGSNGVLLGIIENDDGDAADLAFNHETGLHMLGCCYASNSTLPFSNSGPHINNGLFSFSDSVMDGGAPQYIVQQPSGDWMIVVNKTATAGEISPLAKYFARIIPANAVPSPMCAAFGYTGNSDPGTIILAAQVRCFTIQDVIAQFGPITPARSTFNFNVLPVIRYEDGQLNDALITSTQWMSTFYAGTAACQADTNVPPLPCSFDGAMNGDATLSTTVVLK